MFSSHSANHVSREANECHQHKPVKQVRSHDDTHGKSIKKEQTLIRRNRSTSTGFRQSIRCLTSCALAKRKAGRTTNSDDNSSTTNDVTGNFDEISSRSSKTFLIPNEHSPSLALKKSSQHIEQLKKTASDGGSTSIPLHKQLEKRNSNQLYSTTFTGNSPLPTQSNPNDNVSILNIRKLSNKEISTSLVNLMGTAADSVSVNNTTQMASNQAKQISATSAASTDRLALFGSTSNVGATNTTDSILSQRTVNTGNNPTASTSNSYSWCYESSPTSPEECLSQLEIDNKPLIYRQQFEGFEHFNWYGISETNGPVLISYRYANDQNKQRYILTVVRTRQRTFVESLFDLPSSCSSLEILRRICNQRALTDIEYFDPIFCDGARDLLLKYDESHVSNKHKFGVVYQRANQLTEEDIFSNETHSLSMNKFLDLIGTHVKLKDFQGFRGGLDNKSDHTGTESIYERFHDHEIMFHVSTLLPHSKIERQQLERKRHIGNDIVAIIFQENETVFNPECIASQFLHVYIIITPLDPDGNQFKVAVVYRDSVPQFGPASNSTKIFQCDQTFKQWLLTKLINAEMASYRSSTFQKYQERTKMNLFDNLYRTLHDNNRPFMDFVVNHSQYKHECEIEQQREDSIAKNYDRHTDNSILGTVKRRLIAPKLRVQHTNSPTTTTYLITSSATNNANDAKPKVRTLADDIKRNIPKESMVSNGKVASIFSSSKSSKTEKPNSNRPVLDSENSDSSSNIKFILPSMNDLNSNGDSNSTVTSNNSSSDDIDSDQYSIDYLQSSSKDDLIKYVLSLQQQNSMKLTQIHSQSIQQLKSQVTKKQNSLDKEPLS
ncbi:unnamed protein product [Adineta ricciae]|uniref:Rap-GAP domain-containing protein n=1 Tax=Adineta ricciae TaxID=249248 RepID=A0A815D8B5_ADIRI|nr:unnamed protein product [Adineta ricciae]CAF1294314.1 unnamed protein product [Adineta ricciae]